jgi:flavodoxin
MCFFVELQRETDMGKVLIVFYSMYGHIHQMAEAVADGVREAVLKRVPETLSEELAGARFQGAYVAKIARKLSAG